MRIGHWALGIGHWALLVSSVVAIYRIALSERDRNQLESAHTQIKAAIAILENIRTKVTS